MELSEIQQAIEALPPERRRALLDWMRTLEREPVAATPKLPKPPKLKVARRPATLQSAVLWSVFSILAFLVVDAAIFRSGWYFNYLLPDSTTGQMEFHVFWVLHTLPDKLPEAAVVGGSRIAEGFTARKASAAAGEKIHFWNMGVPGSSPRTWYYMLRDADPDRKRFRSITIAMDRYSDEDRGENPANRVVDLNYLAGRLRVTDCPDFSQSFDDPELRKGMFTGCLFKGATMRRDVQDLLLNRKERLRVAKLWRNDGHGYIDGYEGKPESLAGLTVDFGEKLISFPPGVKDWQSESVRNFALAAPVPQTGALTAYRRLWLGRILDLYKDSQTRIVFLELPGGPVPPPEPTVPARYFDSVAHQPRVTVLPKEMFRDLERPDFYADGLHLNVNGRPVFSERLGRKVAELMGVN